MRPRPSLRPAPDRAPARALRALAVALAIGAAATGAHAETRADALFQEGRKAMKASDWSGALESLSQSYKLEPAPGTLLNVAECETHLGQLVEALEHFKQVEIALPAPDKRRNVASTRAMQLSSRVPRLIVTLAPSAPPGTEIFRGDARVAPGATSLVNPGNVTLRVTAPGRRERALAVSAKEGDTFTLVAEPGEADGAAVATPTPAPSPTSSPAPSAAASKPTRPRDDDAHPQLAAGASGKRTAGLVIGGVGVASLGVGVVTGIMALGKASSVKDHCDGSLACDPQGVDAGAAGKTLSLVSTITVAVGIVGIGVGTYLVVTSKKPGPTTAVAPIVAPGYAGAGLWRTF